MTAKSRTVVVCVCMYVAAPNGKSTTKPFLYNYQANFYLERNVAKNFKSPEKNFFRNLPYLYAVSTTIFHVQKYKSTRHILVQNYSAVENLVLRALHTTLQTIIISQRRVNFRKFKLRRGYPLFEVRHFYPIYCLI